MSNYYLTENDLTDDNNTKLKLFDFEKYIELKNLKEVKNANIMSLTDKNSFDSQGLWSEEIFGRVSSKERKTRFGYITLNIPMLRPVVYKLFKTYSDEIRCILNNTKKYIITKEGELIEDEDNGKTGLLFILKNYEKINFAKCSKKDKTAIGNFLNNNKNLIFITKYWIIPPGGIRDMTLSKNSKQFSSEINEIYEKLISLNDQLKMYSFDDEMESIITQELFNCLLQAHIWNQNQMVGKSGLLRGTMLKKSMDYSSRVIATPSPDIPFGKIGIPWHTLLILYEPFVLHYVFRKEPEIQDDIKDFLGLNKEVGLSLQDYKKFVNNILLNPDQITGGFKQKLLTILEQIVKNKDILVKRDPVVGRGNYFAAEPIVLDHGRGVVINPLHCPPMTLDFDGDCVAMFPVFYKESLKEAAKLNPRKSKPIWLNLQKTGEQNFNLQLDCVSTIYSATKDPDEE